MTGPLPPWSYSFRRKKTKEASSVPNNFEKLPAGVLVKSQFLTYKLFWNSHKYLKNFNNKTV